MNQNNDFIKLENIENIENIENPSVDEYLDKQKHFKDIINKRINVLKNIYDKKLITKQDYEYTKNKIYDWSFE